MKKTALAMAVVGSLGIAGMEAASAAPITSFSITGGSFAMGFFTPGGPITFENTSGVNLVAGYVAPTWDTNVSQATPAPGAIINFDFGGPDVNYYTAASATQAPAVPGGGPVVNGTAGGGSITVDLSSLFANWNGTDFAQGNSSVTGTTTGGTSFSIAWTSLIGGGPPFGGQIGTYTATGTLSAIPVPAAAWLMGSGLIGLVGVARRRRHRS